MVCQEEVFSWFKDLSGYKRLDVMCGLLNVCLPFELRFVGTCVEDLGKKDFHYLREAENRANNTVELTKLTNLKDDVTRSKLIVSLALLESSNHVCSNVIFNILTGEDGKWSQLSRSEDEKVVDEVLLLFTMALYHPAFSFDQKSVVGSQLNEFRKLSKDMMPAKDDQNNKLKESTMNTLESLNCKLTPIWTHVCPAADWNGTWIRQVELKRYQRRKEKKIDFKIQVTWTNCETTEVVKTYQQLYEFSQLITQLCSEESRLHLNDSSIFQLPGNKIYDNAEELSTRVSEFLRSVTKLLPELAGCEGVLSFFPRPVYPTSSPWNAQSPISPAHSPSSSSQGLMLGSVQTSTQPAPGAQPLRLPKEELVAETGRVKSLTIYNSQMDQTGKVIEDNRPKLQSSPATGALRENNTKVPRYNAPMYPTPCSTPVTSPHSSPTPSPFVSPSQSMSNSRVASPWIQRSDVAAQTVAMKQMPVKQERMKKCKPKLNSLTYDELQALTDEELSKGGFSLEFIGQLRRTLRNCPMNGLNVRNGEEVKVSPVMNVSTQAAVGLPSPNAQEMHTTAVLYISPADSQNHSMPRVVGSSRPSPIFSMVPTNSLPSGMVNIGVPNLVPCTAVIFPHLAQPRPMMSQFNSAQPQQQQQMASTESSPSCSEYSSPPGSPSLEIRNNYDSSCSEETERDKDATNVKSSDSKARHGSTNFSCKSKADCPAVRSNVPAKGCSDAGEDAISPVVVTTANNNNNVSCPITNKPASTSLRQVVMPDIVPVSASVPGATIATNSAGLPRSRFNNVPSVSPSSGHCFNSSSPVKSCNNSSTLIFENSQFNLKSIPTAVVSPPPPNMQGRWEGQQSNSGSSTTTTTTVTVHTQNMSAYAMTTTTQATQQQDVTTYRTTSNAPVSSSVMLCTTQQRLGPGVTGNGSAGRSHKNIYSQHPEETHKLNNINSSLPPSGGCVPCLGHGNESHHPVAASYPSTPNTYPNMPPSPGAVNAPPVATCAAPMFLSANSYPLSNQASSGNSVQNQMNSQGILPSATTVCMNNCVCSCNQNTHGAANLPYSPNFLHFPVNYHSFPPYMQAHNANNFIGPATLPPNFHFTGNPMAAPPPPIPNGITPELYSSNQFSVLPQNAAQQSTRVALPGFITGSNPNVAFHNSYANPSAQHLPTKNKTLSCYNCGIVGHRGLDCKEMTMEEITKPGQFRLNYAPSARQMDGPE